MALLVTAFIVRTVFIRLMGAEYTGINSLYSNILSLLSLADLGFSSVMSYELYGPLRDQDFDTVRALVALFRKIYLIVFLVVVAVGLVLVPFLPMIVTSDLDEWHLCLYYLLYLTDSACSYMVVHNRMVITADQKYYVTYALEVACKFVQYILQIVYLLLTHDFVGYLVIQIAMTIVYNLLVNAMTIRMYPYLQTRAVSQVTRETKDRIRKNVIATFVERISNTILNQTDSILISVMFSVVYVGYYSNYNLIVSYISSIIYLIAASVEASVGNLNAEGDYAASWRIYRQFDFAMSFINMTAVVVFSCVVQDFMRIWIGDEYVQSYLLVAALMATFYLQQQMFPVTIYRKTLGLFNMVKAAYLTMAVLNIILSIVLGSLIGVPGVIVATGLSRLLTTFWREGQVVFQQLEHKPQEYYRLQLRSTGVTIVTLLISLWLCRQLQGLSLYVRFILELCVAAVVCVGIYAVLFHGTEEWAWAVRLVRNIFKRR